MYPLKLSIFLVLIMLTDVSTGQDDEEEDVTMKTVTGTSVKVGRKRFENCSLLKFESADVEADAKQTANVSSDGDTLHKNGKLVKLFKHCRVFPTLMNNKFITEHIKLRVLSSIYELIIKEAAPEKCPKFVGEAFKEMICDFVHDIIEENIDYHHDSGYYEYNHYGDEGDPSNENVMSTNTNEKVFYKEWTKLGEKLAKLEQKFYKTRSHQNQ